MILDIILVIPLFIVFLYLIPVIIAIPFKATSTGFDGVAATLCIIAMCLCVIGIHQILG